VDKTALITVDDVEIYIGESTQLAEKDRIAREILDREKGKVVYINVRVVDRPTWRGLETD
jgi:cell division protein FtsQ